MIGGMDEVGIWKRALTPSEITDLYNGGAGRDYAYVSSGGGGSVCTSADSIKRIALTLYARSTALTLTERAVAFTLRVRSRMLTLLDRD